MQPINTAPLNSLRCIVVGGSLGGLTAAQQLLQAGADVHVYERSVGALQDRGAGLGVDPELFRRFLTRPEAREREFRYLHLTHRHGVSPHGESRQPMQLCCTSYDILYRCLRGEVPDDRYHPGVAMTTIEPQPDGAQVRVGFSDGRTELCDLLVCADGYQSTARQQVLPPGVGTQSSYAGYILWRGLMDEAALDQPLREHFFCDAIHIISFQPYHMVVYPVPGRGGETQPGARRLNWGWYYGASKDRLQNELLRDRRGRLQPFSLAPGQCAPEQCAHLRELAAQVWPQPCRDLIVATIAADRLFMQPIYEYMPIRMAADRICLVGDAAHAASPITGSGARYAMYDALALVRALQQHRQGDQVDVPQALQEFERERLRPSQQLVASGQQWGATFR